MQLPVFEGVVDVLERHDVHGKRALNKAKTTPVKKRRIENRAEPVSALNLFDVSPEIYHGWEKQGWTCSRTTFDASPKWWSLLTRLSRQPSVTTTYTIAIPLGGCGWPRTGTTWYPVPVATSTYSQEAVSTHQLQEAGLHTDMPSDPPFAGWATFVPSNPLTREHSKWTRIRENYGHLRLKSCVLLLQIYFICCKTRGEFARDTKKGACPQVLCSSRVPLCGWVVRTSIQESQPWHVCPHHLRERSHTLKEYQSLSSYNVHECPQQGWLKWQLTFVPKRCMSLESPTKKGIHRNSQPKMYTTISPRWAVPVLTWGRVPLIYISP